MADVTQKQLEKCRRVYDALRENQAKSYALLEELGALLAGDEGIGVKVNRIMATFSTLWSGRYNSPYAWSFVRDKPQIKRLLGLMDEATLGRRIENYLRDGSKYLTDARHPFALFVSSVNRYADAGEELELLAPPADCKHTPPCRSEQQHTSRRSKELRA